MQRNFIYYTYITILNKLHNVILDSLIIKLVTSSLLNHVIWIIITPSKLNMKSYIKHLWTSIDILLLFFSKIFLCWRWWSDFFFLMKKTDRPITHHVERLDGLDQVNLCSAGKRGKKLGVMGVNKRQYKRQCWVQYNTVQYRDIDSAVHQNSPTTYDVRNCCSFS